ncbi:MAG TPA: hypothetical protein VIQ53_19130, partial [Inquilinus sp.]
RHALAVLSDLGEPDAPYRHLGGAGAGEGWVTVEALGRWVEEGGIGRSGDNPLPLPPPAGGGGG